MQGRAVGLFSSMYYGAMPLGMAVFGPAADRFPSALPRVAPAIPLNSWPIPPKPAPFWAGPRFTPILTKSCAQPGHGSLGTESDHKITNDKAERLRSGQTERTDRSELTLFPLRRGGFSSEPFAPEYACRSAPLFRLAAFASRLCRNLLCRPCPPHCGPPQVVAPIPSQLRRHGAVSPPSTPGLCSKRQSSRADDGFPEDGSGSDALHMRLCRAYPTQNLRAWLPPARAERRVHRGKNCDIPPG